MGFRDIASATNERTCITAVFPTSAVGNSINLILGLDGLEAAAFTANANSFVFDFCCRQKVSGTHVNIWIFKQLPAIPFETYAQPCPWALHPQSTIHDPPTLRDWLLPRVLELTYTAWDLEAFAADCLTEANSEQRVASGEDISSHSPFATHHSPEEASSEQRMANGKDAGVSSSSLSPLVPRSSPLLSAFPTPRHAVSYIMDTFPIVKRKDESKHGTYRTKETILQIYDALAHSIATGQPYQTLLNPPPADPGCCHPPKS